jgi:hypothetical protein
MFNGWMTKDSQNKALSYKLHERRVVESSET